MKVSRFTPSLMNPEDLEEIFVQRHKIAQRIVELIGDSAQTPSKHHTLLIGARGIGKTHLVSLIYHRIRKIDKLHDRLLIAWLREEEWGIASFLDLLLRIFRALEEEYHNNEIAEKVEALYSSPETAEDEAAAILKEYIGNRTLLLLMENLDEVFAGLNDKGQRRLRAFLQENACCTIVATSQNLFNGVKLQSSPFYGFFHIRHLEALTPEDAAELLANVAKLKGDRELESFIRTSTGRDRVKAVHHLAGGNHRVFVIFSEFLTRASLDELVEPFMRTLDDLTPYYQARMAWLSPQQRKIVEFLCDCRHPVPVKEIAKRCFISHQTTSAQLKELREKGYVASESIGRESYYELREPLMRFCLEVKKQRGKPIRLFVDFLRFWYTQTELQQQLQMLKDDSPLEREYLLDALQRIQKDIDTHEKTHLHNFTIYFKNKQYTRALKASKALLKIERKPDFLLRQVSCLLNLKKYTEAVIIFNEIIALEPKNAYFLFFKSRVLSLLSYYDEALMSCNKAIELNPENHFFLVLKSELLLQLKDFDGALVYANKALALDDENLEAWRIKHQILLSAGRYREAIETANQRMGFMPDDALIWMDLGVKLLESASFNKSLGCFEKAIELDADEEIAWMGRGIVLFRLDRYEEALAAYDKAIALGHNDKNAWDCRGNVLQQLKRYDEALASYDKAIALGYQSFDIFFNRAQTLLALNRWQEGCIDLDNALTRFARVSEFPTHDTEAIIRNLFNNTNDVKIWRLRIKTLIDIYDKHQVFSALGQGLARSIPVLMSEMVSDAAVRTWLEAWQEVVSDHLEFQVPLRLLNAAVRYRETKGDPRILLELAIEERSLLKPLLGIREE